MSDEHFERKEPTIASLSRRKLFSILGFGSLFLAIGGILNGVLAYMLPNMNYEPSSKVAVGRPEDFQVGEMKLIESAQVFMFYDPLPGGTAGFQAVSAVCTHLGCSYKPFRPEDISDYGCPVYAHCPCHGSVFCRNGDNVGGPAPRPLPFFVMELSSDGRILVDKGLNNMTDDLSTRSGQGVAHDLYLDPGSGVMVQGPLPTGEGTIFLA